MPPSDSVRALHPCAGRGDNGGWYGNGLMAAGDGDGSPVTACGDTVPGWMPSMQYGSLNPVDVNRRTKIAGGKTETETTKPLVTS